MTVRRLGHLGDGITDEGFFVPGALPGEAVEGDPVEGRLTGMRILEPSAARVSAPCPHYRACGGCDLMHASDPFVRKWKEGVVREALGAQGIEAPFRPTFTAPPGTRRRATFAGRRTRSGAVVGFHGRASGTIVENPGCLVLDPRLLALRGAMAALTAAGASRKGELGLAATVTNEGIDLAVTDGKTLEPTLFQAISDIGRTAGLARVTWNGEVVVQDRLPTIRFGNARVPLPAGAFLQATPEAEAALVADVAEALGDAGRVVDLFAGAGTFTLPLAGTAEVLAVEGDRSLLAALDAGWRSAPGLRRVTTETRDLFRRPLMPDELARFDAAVIDPPRAGAEAQVREIARSRLSRLVCVSCNPVTFARDAAILVHAGFRIDWLRVVDQFRWSHHIELAARLSR